MTQISLLQDPPDTAAIAGFIKCETLTSAEIFCLQEIADAIDNANIEAAKAFTKAAGIVRPDVLIRFGALYHLDEEQVRFALSTTTDDWDAMKALRRKERNASIVAGRAEGKTQKQLAEEHGISERQVRDVLVTGGAPDTSNDQRAKLTDGQKQIIKDRVANGDSQTEVAEDFGVSQQKVSQIVNGKTGNESKAEPKPTPVVEAPPTDGKLHSPSLALMQEEGHELNKQMQLNRKRYYDTMRLLFDDINKATKRFKTLSNLLNDDYAKNHGGMLARWYAYESLWADDFDQLATGARSYQALAQHAAAQLTSLATSLKQSHEHLRRIKPENITLHD